MERKSFAIFTLIAVLLFSSLSVIAKPRSDEFTKVKNVEYSEVQNLEKMSSREVKEIFNKITSKYKNMTYSAEELEKASKTAEKAKSFLNINNQNNINDVDDPMLSQSNDYYDLFLNDLRKGNYIEGLLNVDEGMTTVEMTLIVAHAVRAKDASKDEYPNDSMLEDAFRHFSWNHMCTSDDNIGKTKTRTATINHEWGPILVQPAINIYTRKYEDYIASGHTDQEAATRAFNSTIVAIPRFKQDTILVCEANYSFFKGIFGVSHIMDLHNNCYGRAYPASDPSLDYREAFHKSRRAGELILDEKDVNNDHYYQVWAWDWYTY